MPAPGSNKSVKVWDNQAMQKARTTNASDASFPSKVPTVTKPTGGGVVTVRSQGVVPAWLKVQAYGLGSNNDAFGLKLIGWQHINTLWVPTPLVILACTLSSSITGVAGAAVLDTEYFADTMTATLGQANVTYVLNSPADDATIAHALVSPDGCELVEFTFDQTTGTPTMNALYSRM